MLSCFHGALEVSPVVLLPDLTKRTKLRSGAA